MIHDLIHGYNIAPTITRAANARHLEATATGGGCDYICRYIGQRGRVLCTGDNSYLYAFKHNGAGLFTTDIGEARAALLDRSDERVQRILDGTIYVWKPEYAEGSVMVLGTPDDAGSPHALSDRSCVTLYFDANDWSDGGFANFVFDTAIEALDFMAAWTSACVETGGLNTGGRE